MAVPTTLDAALEPGWLAQALKGVGGGRAVAEVAVVEVIRTMATKVRFTVRFDGSDEVHAFCLKGFLDVGDAASQGGATTVLEADFYDRVAPHVGVRVPECIAAIIDRDAPLGVIIMRDLIAAGARFCTALE
ncbi:MAG TPA: aminoglycoside phosphotransferase family protein, partial [Novosphingobium sp.]